MLGNLRKQFLDVRRGEGILAFLMAAYFFLVITTFWILKPLKKTIFVAFYETGGFALPFTSGEGGPIVFAASQAELLAKVANMFVAALAVVAFTWLARRLRRDGLSLAFSAFFVAMFAWFAFLVASPGGGTAWSFYLLGDLWTTIMVATFFAFLNDSVTPEAAKRLYGPVVLGGVLGGAFGSVMLAGFLEAIPTSGWLWVCLALTVVIAGLAWAAGRRVRQNPPPEVSADGIDPGRDEPTHTRGNAALEGARLVFRSRYLLAIVAIVGIYEIVSTILDFQFTETIVQLLDGDAIGAQFATVYAFTNVVALLVQIFVTTFVMTRFGVGVALLVTPAVMLLGSGAFLAAPLLLTGSFLNTADNGFAYSINQSAREALYTPTSRDEKYKAKAFIDMFVQRFAKAVAVGVSLLITLSFTTADGGIDFAGIRWLSAIVVVLLAVWALAARYAGRRFRELEAADVHGVTAPPVRA